jgi:rubrerythrin
MPDELAELLDTAIYKEIASQAVYEAAQGRTDDPAAKSLLQELAKEEHGHTEKLKKLKDQGTSPRTWVKEQVPNLKISEHLAEAGNALRRYVLSPRLLIPQRRPNYGRTLATV